jgi:hypothetical protein
MEQIRTWLINIILFAKDSEAEARLNNILYKNLVRTGKRTPQVTITKVSWLMLFKEMTTYTENHTKAVNTTFSVHSFIFL